MATVAWSTHADQPSDSDGRISLRRVILVLAVLAMLLSATGVTAHEVFHQPSTLKYLITVFAPAFVAFLALTANPLRALTCLTIILTPINFVATLEGIQVTPQVALIVLALPVIAVNWRPRPSGWLGPASVGIVLCLLPAILHGQQPLSYAIWIVVTMVMGWLAFHLASEPGGPRLVLISIGIAAFIQGVIAVYEYKSGHVLNLYSSAGVQSASPASNFYNYGGTIVRPSGTLSDPIALGNLLSLSLPLLVCLSALETRRWLKLGLAILAGAATLGLIFSYSRISWVAAGLGVPLSILLLPRGPRLKTAIGVIGLSAVIITIGISVGGSTLATRFSSLLNPTDTHSKYSSTAKTDRLREREWSASLKVFEHTPLGRGFGNVLPAMAKEGFPLPPYADPQNFYLDIMAQAGLLGLLALILLFGSTLRDMWVAFKHNRVFIAGVTGAILALVIGWTTDVSPRYTDVSGEIAALLGAVSATAAATRSRLRDAEGTEAARLVLRGPEPPGPDIAPTLVLAEGATSFVDTFAGLDLPFAVRTIDDHEYEPGGPMSVVRHNALRRALAAVRQGEPEAVLGIDRRVMLGMRPCAPPETEAEAREVLSALSGRVHHVISAVALIWKGGVRTAVSATAVTLRQLTPEQIEWYLATGEWVGQLGAYDIEGAGASLVERIDGDYENLTGVPPETLLDVYPALFDEA